VWRHSGARDSVRGVRHTAYRRAQSRRPALVTHCPDSPSPVWSNSSMSDMDCSAQSPCIRNCCLDDDLTCLGCFRSLEEIKEWGVVDNQRRLAILQNARQRRLATQGEVSPLAFQLVAPVNSSR
jgi:predicted Fe-S protein YdhL (DUF1289 family)